VFVHTANPVGREWLVRAGCESLVIWSLVLGVWFVVSFPVGVVVGRMMKEMGN